MSVTSIIPTFVIEEHHEAFLVWHHAIANHLIPESDNCLLHFDEHSDMSMPRLNISADHMGKDQEAIQNFTYNELNIANFILVAVYQGLFDEVIWVKQQHKHLEPKRLNMFVSSYNDLGKKLMTGKVSAEVTGGTEEIKSYREYRYSQLNGSQLEVLDAPFLLDIDLDYFSCTQNPYESKEIEVEISETEYKRFQNDPYHKLRFITSRLETKIQDGKYYYVINKYDEIYESPLKMDEEVINMRLSAFFSQLAAQREKPMLITICRSRYSGFTPEDQWAFIENALLEGLQRLYGINVVHIKNLQVWPELSV